MTEPSTKLKRDMKTRHKTVPVEQRLGLEMLAILWSYYLLRKLPLKIQSDDALENLEKLKFTELLISDLILRLCKLREDNTNSISFVQVLKALRKRVATKDRVVSMETEIKRFTTLTRTLMERRNSYIAHLAKQGHSHLKPMNEMSEVIGLALKITDTLCGENNSYKILNIDLRHAFSRGAAV